jgi:hypothetical protein
MVIRKNKKMKFFTILKYLLAVLLWLPASVAESQLINSDAIWRDTDGNEIQAQGGCILKYGETFYWYGVEFKGETPNQVRCYSSNDLLRWKFEKPVLTKNVSHRVKVLYSDSTKQFVMFTRKGTKLAVSFSADPAGVFVTKGETRLPGAVKAGDLATFLDDEGRAYLVYTRGAGEDEKEKILCARLNPDWMGVANVIHEFTEGYFESPAICKHGALYYCTASGINGWFSSGTSYCTAPDLNGPWSQWKKINKAVIGGGLLESTYNSQHNTVFKIEGTQGALIVYMGDRWSQFTKYGVGMQVWLPIEFAGDVPVLTWMRPWYPDVRSGNYQHDLRRYGLWRDPPK